MRLSTENLVLQADAAIDLQMHTINSDGKWTPEQLLDHLVQENFGLAAITDHDRTDNIAAVQALAIHKHIPILVAAEMTTNWHGEMMDVLCFGFDPNHAGLNALTRDVLYRQQENTREVYSNLLRKGYEFPEETNELDAILEKPSAQQLHELVLLVKRYSNGETSAGKIIREAGGDFASTEIAKVVDVVHQSGGVCLIAHPGRSDGYVNFDARLLDQLRGEVPMDGFEVYYPIHTPAQTEMFREYARRHNLLTSSGSDSHGPDKPPIKYRAELSRGLLEQLGILIR